MRQRRASEGGVGKDILGGVGALMCNVLTLMLIFQISTPLQWVSQKGGRMRRCGSDSILKILWHCMWM